MILNVKRLDPRATLPTVANTGDLAYDLYALENTWVAPGAWLPTKVRTGIAVQSFTVRYSNWTEERERTPLGLIIKDRSSMAAKGFFTVGGVIDAGYTGEIAVLMHKIGAGQHYCIKAGDKIAQMVPVPVLTGAVIEVDELAETVRGGQGFGSSGV